MSSNELPNEPSVNKMDNSTISNTNNNDKVNNLLPATKKQRTPKQLEAFKKMREQRQKNLELKKQLKSTKKKEEYEEESQYESSDNNYGGGMNNPPAVAVSPQRNVELKQQKPRPPQRPKPEPTRPKPQPRQLKQKEEYYDAEEEEYYDTQPVEQNIIYNYIQKSLPREQKVNYLNNPYGLNSITYNPQFIQKHVNTEQNSRRIRRQIPNIPWNPNAYY
jgi:predicted RND superfamily exporter protein